MAFAHARPAVDGERRSIGAGASKFPPRKTIFTCRSVAELSAHTELNAVCSTAPGALTARVVTARLSLPTSVHIPTGSATRRRASDDVISTHRAETSGSTSHHRSE